MLGFKLRVDLSGQSSPQCVKRRVNENGIFGMPEAADIKQVDNVSPFIDPILDRYCGKGGTGFVSK